MHPRVRAEADGATAVPWPPGENVKPFFSRVAALAFEQSVLRDLERRSSARLQVGNGDLIRMEGGPPETQESKRLSSLGCC